MRVLLISGSLPPMKCGVGDYTANLASALAQREDTSVAVLTDAAAQPVPTVFGFDVFPVVEGWKMADITRIAKVVRRWRPDLVHVQYPTQGYGGGHLPWLLPTLFSIANFPVVQTWHNYHSETDRRNLLNAALGGGLISVRPDYTATMPNWYRWLIRRKRFKFIPNASGIPRTRLAENEKLAIRSRFAPPPIGLVAYFGFVFPQKRVDLVFDIADPQKHHIILICDLNPEDQYHKVILDRASHAPWVGKVTVTGFLPAPEVGRILATADAVVLPFRDGGGIWNTSIHAALTQGTFVLTTARDQCGYDPSRNIYYARPDDVTDMSYALRTHISRRNPEVDNATPSEWEEIAGAHRAFYAALCEN